MQIKLYTDGSCDLHAANRPGGWAAILLAINENGDSTEKVLSGNEEHSSNNRMELRAVIQGLQALQRPTALTVVTDSKYIIGIAKDGNRIRANRDLWKEFDTVAKGHSIDWQYVAGHSGDLYNERCDRLAVQARKKLAVPAPVPSPLVTAADTEIYLSTHVDKQLGRTGWATIILHGGERQEMKGTVPVCSEPEAALAGAVATLERLPAVDAVTLFTAQKYLADGLHEWLPNWQKRGWKKKDGKPVKYIERWQRLWQLSQAGTVQIHFVKSRDGHGGRFQQAKELARAALQSEQGT